ncbi:MAG: SGNH/GDSL hydrolase family protein [Janthinobacterium lividum]
MFLGSSTFQGLDTSSVTPVGLNLSIGGDTLEGLIQRSAAYRSLETARAVIVNIGLNDLMRGCAQPEAQVEELFRLVPAETPVIVLGVQGVQESAPARRCQSVIAKLIDEFNRTLLNACSSKNNCQFVPNPVASNMNPHTKKLLQEADGVHLSQRGYQALSNALRDALSKVDARLATIE